MTTTQAVETSATVNNCPFQDYPHPDNHAPPSYEITPGFKPFTIHCTLFLGNSRNQTWADRVSFVQND